MTPSKVFEDKIQAIDFVVNFFFCYTKGGRQQARYFLSLEVVCCTRFNVNVDMYSLCMNVNLGISPSCCIFNYNLWGCICDGPASNICNLVACATTGQSHMPPHGCCYKVACDGH